MYCDLHMRIIHTGLQPAPRRMKIHLSASSATNNSMPDLIRHPEGEVAGYPAFAGMDTKRYFRGNNYLPFDEGSIEIFKGGY
jgi:hypothetical protein